MPTMELKSKYVFTLHVKLAEPIDFGNTFNGDRRLIPITGGHFEGPKIKGQIMPGGKDSQIEILGFLLCLAQHKYHAHANYVLG